MQSIILSNYVIRATSLLRDKGYLYTLQITMTSEICLHYLTTLSINLSHIPFLMSYLQQTSKHNYIKLLHYSV